MKKIACFAFVLLLCAGLTATAFAATGTFVPSITYKDGPDVEDVVLGGEDVSECLEVTSITEAEEGSTDISQQDRDELLDVYEKLEEGSMTLPIEGDDYVIRELVDVSFKKSVCIDEEHGKEEELAKEGVTISVTFDLGVDADTEVKVFTYVDGKWSPAVSVTNNGDGTVTCVFEDICPVAFCVQKDAETVAPETGDNAGSQLYIWIAIMVISLAAIIVLTLKLSGRLHKAAKR